MKFLKCFLSLFLVFCMILPPVCFVQAEGSGLQRIFYDDFEQYEVGDTPSYSGGDLSKWTTVVRGTESPVAVMEEAGNKILSLGRVAEAKEAAGPRAEKVLPVGADAKISVHCKVKTNSQVFQLSVRSAVTTDSTTIFNFSGDDVLSRAPAGAELSPDAWISLTFELDCRSMKYTSYINGYTYMRNAALNASINFDGGLKLHFGTSVQPGTAVYLDEVEILSDDSLLTEGKLLDIFKLRTDSDVLLTPFLRQSHPRIYVSDFDEVKEKIRTDQLAAGWYASVKASADTYLQAEPEAYAPESGILTDVSRRIMYKLYVLAFVYAIEEDPVYRQRAIEEIVNADQFPSWHPNNFLGVAELGGGVAVAYDWMYNGMTETERETVRNVILNKTLYLGALSYEGISDTFFVTATSNWNFVCNGGLVLSALAISDEYPLLADYIFNKAADSLPYATGITFAPEGAFPEGPGYWEYAAYNFVDMIAALESAVDDGKTMPDKFDFSDTVGLAETLDFPIATHSTVGRFNYGDNVPAYGSPIDLHIAYWMAKKYNKPEYAAYQMQTRDLLGNYGMPWKTTLKLIWYDPYGVENRDTAFPLDKAYSNENGPNIISLRSSWAEEGELYVGMQGGLNGSAHSFLSLGTFVLDAMGERRATLIGQGNYRWPGYFDMESQRWTYYNCNTEGQNCVVLNADAGPQQNISALARTVDFKSSDDEAYGVLDLTAAYESAVSDYKRGGEVI